MPMLFVRVYGVRQAIVANIELVDRLRIINECGDEESQIDLQTIEAY